MITQIYASRNRAIWTSLLVSQAKTNFLYIYSIAQSQHSCSIKQFSGYNYCQLNNCMCWLLRNVLHIKIPCHTSSIKMNKKAIFFFWFTKGWEPNSIRFINHEALISMLVKVSGMFIICYHVIKRLKNLSSQKKKEAFFPGLNKSVLDMANDQGKYLKLRILNWKSYMLKQANSID